MNILNTINNELDIIKTKELPHNSTNVSVLDSQIKILMNKFVRKHPNSFAQLIGPLQSGGFGGDDIHGINDIMKIYLDIDAGYVKDKIASIDTISNYLQEAIRKKKDNFNKNREILDTDEKIINTTATINIDIKKSLSYGIFNYTYEDIHDIVSDKGPAIVETNRNYLMDSNNFFMINRLNAMTYLSDYPLLNSYNHNNAHIEKTYINATKLHMYEVSKTKYNKLVDDYTQHVKLVVNTNKSSNSKKIHRLINKELLQKYNLIASAIKKDMPTIYIKIQIMIDTVINFTESLLRVIGDNTLNLELINSDCGAVKLGISYGVNLINCIESIINTLIS